MTSHAREEDKEFDFHNFSTLLTQKNISARVEADKHAEKADEDSEKYRAKGYWQGWEDATRYALYTARLVIEGEVDLLKKQEELKKLRDSLRKKMKSVKS